MAIAKGILEVWKPQIRIVRNTGALEELLEPAVWVSCDTYENAALNVRRGNALTSFNYSDKVFEPTVASFRLSNRPHDFKAIDSDIYEYVYKDSEGTGIPVPSSMYDSTQPYYGLTAGTGNVRLRQRWGVFTNFFYEFQHIRLVDKETHLVLFQGRITKISKKYEDGNGSVVVIEARDALDQIANISNSNLVKNAAFSTSHRRSDLIKYILNLALNYESSKPTLGPEVGESSPTVSDLASTDGSGAMVTADSSSSLAANSYSRFEQSVTQFVRETIWKAGDTGSKHVLSEIGRWALLDPHASNTTENSFGYDYFVDPNYGKYNLDATKGPGVAGWNSPQFNYFKRGNRLSGAGSSSQDAGVYGLTVKYPTITTAKRQGARYYNIGTTAESGVAGDTTFSVQNGHEIRPGYVIQIGNEHMYVLAVYPDDEGVSTNDEIQVIRGFSATDAVSFSSGDTIRYPRPAQTIMQSAFNFEDTKEDLATEAVLTYNTKKDSQASDGTKEEKERIKQKRLEIMYVTEVAAGTVPNNTTPFHWDGRNMDEDFENPAFAYSAETLDAYNAAGAKQADDVGRIQYQSHATLTGSTNFAYILVSDIKSTFPTANYGSDTYVELRGSVSGAKCRLNLAAGITAAHEGRPSKVWGVRRVIDMGAFNDDDPTDLRKEVAARLAQATTGLRQGSYSFSKAPYYWWEGQILNVANHADGQTIEVKDLNGTAAIKVTNFGIRAGMLVHKMTNNTFNIISQANSKDVYGYISSMTDDDTFVVDLTESQSFAADDFIKIIIPLKAGSEVFVDNVIADVYGEHIITEISFSEDPIPETRVRSIGKNESRISGGQKVRGFVPAIAQAVFETKERVNSISHQPQGFQYAFFSATVPNGSEAATRYKATWSAGQVKLLDGRVYQFLAGSTAVSTYGLGANMATGTGYIVYLDPEGENLGPSGSYHLYTKATSAYVQDADNIPIFHITVSSNAAATKPSLRLQNNVVFDQTAVFKVDATDSLEAASITEGVLANLSIAEGKLADLAVTTAKLRDLAVSSAKITDGLISGKTFVDTGLEIDTGGYIRTTDKDSYADDNTAGFWLGKDGSTHKLNIGSSTNYIKWTGTALEVKGSITIAGESAPIDPDDFGDLNADMDSSDVTTKIAGLVMTSTQIHMGSNGVHGNNNTPFYVNSNGNFSIGAGLVWTASTNTLAIAGTIENNTIRIGGGWGINFGTTVSGTGASSSITYDHNPTGTTGGTANDGTTFIYREPQTAQGGAGRRLVILAAGVGVTKENSALLVSNMNIEMFGGAVDISAGSGITDGTTGITSFIPSGTGIGANSSDSNVKLATEAAIIDYVAANSGSSGTVTEITTVSPISGGAITSTGAISHLDTAGNKHIPTGGSGSSGSKQVLTYNGASGDATFQNASEHGTHGGGGGNAYTIVQADPSTGGSVNLTASASDTLVLTAANPSMEISGDANSDTVTFTGNAFRQVTAGGNTLTATGDDTLNFTNGAGISIVGNTSTDTITIAYTGESSASTSSEAHTTGSHQHTLASGHDGSHTGGTNNYVAVFTGTNILQSAVSSRTTSRMYVNNIYFNGTSPYCGSSTSPAYQVRTGRLFTTDPNVYHENLGTNSSSTNYLKVHNTSGLVTEVSSTRKVKENIVDLTIDTSKLYDLVPRNFKFKDQLIEVWNDETDETTSYTEVGENSFGMIAEEVNEILPELVVLDKNQEPKSIDYPLLSVLLLSELKKMQARIEVLENNG